MIDTKLPIPLSLKEIALIKELRKIEFGVIEVHKLHGNIVRIESKISKQINDTDGLSALISDEISVFSESLIIESKGDIK